ncbi:MAG TPA: hypothetical protein DGG95_16835 [Cytophagales bacterium]|jgi:hypothetical protein|nr:hypothetical protein [Cytophagales bacterium]
METLKVKISATEKKRLKISRNEIDFSEFERLIKLAIARDRMKKVVQSARASSLSKMTSQEINAEIKAYRRSAKTNR